jgi:alpha-amylase/alpha-mannosidase (GH57 family)
VLETFPLHIAFVWHMHQPYYKASSDGEYLLPWVRMHALKDYADMVDILAEFPGIRQTFNLVPSLLEQLEEYARGGFRENHWDLTLRRAEELDASERAFVVEFMCEQSWHPRAQRFPRYLELARKREACRPLGMARCAAEFSVGELRDLQVWFNLAWFDPLYQGSEPLSTLVARGRDFTEDDKLALAQAQETILRRTVPAYAEAEKEGAIELTTSAYFHPILPLLMNTDSARVARGDLKLPARRFSHPEDALQQIDIGLAKHEAVFGHPAQGFWCPEMSLGEDVILPLADRGLRWTIGDEEHLARSVDRSLTRDEAGRLHEPDRLYRPYRLEREGRQLDVVFRDHALSDLIGFTYQSWAPRDAAANLVWRLSEIRRELARSHSGPHLVTIALDGENAWEYYQDDGREFLRYLYQMLTDDEAFSCVTVSEFLEAYPPERELPWLHTGSWIYGDFSTWMGDPAHGPAWDLLHEARDTVAARKLAASEGPQATGPDPQLEEAWQHILVAEGSDWFWWFGEHQHSEIDHLWDLTFRQHLQAAYRLAGAPPPLELFAPLLKGAPQLPERPATAAISPAVDGRVDPPDEWEGAGAYRSTAGGTMQRAGDLILEELRYGAGPEGLHLLLSPGAGFGTGAELRFFVGSPAGEGVSLQGSGAVSGRPGERLLIRVRPLEPGVIQVTLEDKAAGEEEGDRLVEAAAWDQVVEITVPWGDLALPAGSTRLELAVAVVVEDQLFELWPPVGALHLDLGALDLLGQVKSAAGEV